MQSQEQVMIMKGKRSKRRSNPSTTATSSSFTSDVVSSSRDEEEEHDLANCLILLAKGPDHHKPLSDPTVENFQCKTCNKSFTSFQALGGHRASHKRPNKPIIEDFQIKGDNDSTVLSLRMISSTRVVDPKKSNRVHECSICGAEFSSGQALGGHMRRHRAVQPPGNDIESKETKRPRNLMLSLDLNLPAAPEDDDHLESKFPYVTKEQVIVFSNTSLVDCHY